MTIEDAKAIWDEYRPAAFAFFIKNAKGIFTAGGLNFRLGWKAGADPLNNGRDDTLEVWCEDPHVRVDPK